MIEQRERIELERNCGKNQEKEEGNPAKRFNIAQERGVAHDKYHNCRHQSS